MRWERVEVMAHGGCESMRVGRGEGEEQEIGSADYREVNPKGQDACANDDAVADRNNGGHDDTCDHRKHCEQQDAAPSERVKCGPDKKKRPTRHERGGDAHDETVGRAFAGGIAAEQSRADTARKHGDDGETIGHGADEEGDSHHDCGGFE